MLYTIAVVLLAVWAMGVASGYTGGGLIHVLLAMAIVLLIVKLLSRRKRVLKNAGEKSRNSI